MNEKEYKELCEILNHIDLFNSCSYANGQKIALLIKEYLQVKIAFDNRDLPLYARQLKKLYELSKEAEEHLQESPTALERAIDYSLMTPEQVSNVNFPEDAERKTGQTLYAKLRRNEITQSEYNKLKNDAKPGRSLSNRKTGNKIQSTSKKKK